jgi:hypothetical protein
MKHTFEVRDKRTGFAWINNEIIDEFLSEIGPSAFAVYVILARHANNETQLTFPSQERLGELLGMSRRTIYSALKLLCDYRLIRIEKSQHGGYVHNVYTLLQPCAKSACGFSHEQPTAQPPAIGDTTTCSRLPNNKTHELDSQTRLTGVCSFISDDVPYFD